MARELRSVRPREGFQPQVRLRWPSNENSKPAKRHNKLQVDAEAHETPSAPSHSSGALNDLFAYQRDLWERTILFWDTLRQRADNMLAHERAGKPPLLDFDYEMMLDARRFERPTNYALLRITRYADKCLKDCLDPAKPPVIIVDPRAGHGPGIGDCGHDAYSVRFEERRVEDLRFPADRTAFRRVAEVSKHFDNLYSATLGKWVQTFSTPLSEAALEWLHPMRSSRYVPATVFAPWQRIIASLAASIAKDRHAVPDDNMFKAQEIAILNAIRDSVEQMRRVRDAAFERLFQAIYGGGSVVADDVQANMESRSTAHCQHGSPVRRACDQDHKIGGLPCVPSSLPLLR